MNQVLGIYHQFAILIFSKLGLELKDKMSTIDMKEKLVSRSKNSEIMMCNNNKVIDLYKILKVFLIETRKKR